MTFDDVYELSEHIPNNSRAFNSSVLPFGMTESAEVGKFAACYKDLSFLWNFVKSFLDVGGYLPNDFRAFQNKEEYELMRRVFNFERFEVRDRELAHAISIDRVLAPLEKKVLRACLLSGDFDLDEVSRKVGISKSVIKIYEKLFFNVLDRKKEHLFIASIVYPESRLVEFDPDYTMQADYGAILQRAGYRGNVDDVLNMAGVRGYITTGPTQMIVADFENRIMCNALFLARAGFLNTNNLGVTNAKNLLAAAKHGGDTESGKSDDSMGAASIGENLMDEVVRFSMDELDDRRQFVIEMNESEG